MRANLLPLTLGTLLISALSACSVNYYVGGTRYQQAPPQPAYNYDYPPQQPPTTVVVTGPVRTPPPPVRTPPVRTTPPPVRTPPVRNNPGNAGGGHGSGTSSNGGSTQPGNAGGGLLPTAPPKPMPTTATGGTGNNSGHSGPVRQPIEQNTGGGLLPTAPPKPMPTSGTGSGSVNHPGTQVVGTEPELMPTAPPKPMPTSATSGSGNGSVSHPGNQEVGAGVDLMPTAPPKPMPNAATSGTGSVSQSGSQELGNDTELMPTAPPKPAPGRVIRENHNPGREPIREPELMPTAPPKPAPTQNQPQQTAPTEKQELLPTAPPKPAPTNAEPASGGTEAPERPKRGRIREVVQSSSSSNQAAPAQAAGAPVLVLRKTPCFGFCPYFEASIYADGRVHYVGHRNVAKVGTYELQVSADAVRQLLKQAEEIGFANFQDQYLSGATDLPSTYLTYNGKTVQSETGAPQELLDLLTAVNNLVETVSGGANPDR